MKKPQDLKPATRSVDDAAAEQVALVVGLVARALDGLALNDAELTALCDAAFPDIKTAKKNGKHEPS